MQEFRNNRETIIIENAVDRARMINDACGLQKKVLGLTLSPEYCLFHWGSKDHFGNKTEAG